MWNHLKKYHLGLLLQRNRHAAARVYKQTPPAASPEVSCLVVITSKAVPEHFTRVSVEDREQHASKVSTQLTAKMISTDGLFFSIVESTGFHKVCWYFFTGNSPLLALCAAGP